MRPCMQRMRRAKGPHSYRIGKTPPERFQGTPWPAMIHNWIGYLVRVMHLVALLHLVLVMSVWQFQLRPDR